MSKDDNYMKLLEKLNAIHTDVAVIKIEVSNIKKDVTKNTADLADHIRGVQTNAARLEVEKQSREQIGEAVEDIKDRLSKVEEFPKFMTFFRKSIIYVGGIAAAIYTILRLFNIDIF